MELEAYVINTKPLSKSDVLITVITPKGLFTIFGRGYMNLKHKYHILINRGIKVKIYGDKKGDYFRLSDCDLLSSETILTLDIEKFEQYTKIVKLVIYIDHLLDETSFALFDFCVSELENYNINLLLDLWKIFILKKENIILNLKTCTKCGAETNLKTLSIKDGGLICNNCYQGEVILEIEDIKMINALYNTKIKVLKEGYSQNVSLFLTELIDYSIGLKID